MKSIKLTLLISCTLISTCCIAQKTTSKPRITPAPDKMDAQLLSALKEAPSQDKYPGAIAIHLLDLSDITIHEDGTWVEKNRQAFKLLSGNARKLAEVNIPYNKSFQEITFEHAKTFQKSGKVLKVKDNELMEYSPFSDFPLYDDAKGFGFSMPGVEDDSVIDYAYTLNDFATPMKRQYWFRWSFDGQHPVVLSRLILRVSTKSKFQFRV